MSLTDQLSAEGFTKANALLSDECIYVLISNDVAIYVGHSCQPQIRIQRHRDMGRVFDTVWIMGCASEDALDIEKKLIAALNPTENIYSNGKPRSAPVEILVPLTDRRDTDRRRS